MTIDQRYCPPIVAGVCDQCARYSSYCQARTAGVTTTFTCRSCRALNAQPPAVAEAPAEAASLFYETRGTQRRFWRGFWRRSAA